MVENGPAFSWQESQKKTDISKTFPKQKKTEESSTPKEAKVEESTKKKKGGSDVPKKNVRYIINVDNRPATTGRSRGIVREDRRGKLRNSVGYSRIRNEGNPLNGEGVADFKGKGRKSL